MLRRVIPTTAIATLMATTALADAFADRVAETYERLGFDDIEVTPSLNRVLIEGVRDATRYEVIYDRDTGEILTMETGDIDGDDADEDEAEEDDEDRDDDEDWWDDHEESNDDDDDDVEDNDDDADDDDDDEEDDGDDDDD